MCVGHGHEETINPLWFGDGEGTHGLFVSTRNSWSRAGVVGSIQERKVGSRLLPLGCFCEPSKKTILAELEFDEATGPA
jgi:hypothetical protein